MGKLAPDDRSPGAPPDAAEATARRGSLGSPGRTPLGEPWLSVVIPTRDTPELTLACVASLQEAGGEVEVIVVYDAGSGITPDAVEQRFPAVRVIRRREHGGFSVAANQGLRQAHGEVLLLLNSDTEVDSGALDSLRQRFEDRPHLGIAGGLLRYPDGAAQWSGGREPTLPWLFALASGLGALLSRAPLYRRALPVGGHGREVTWVPGAAMAIRRSTWEVAGPFDESFAMYCQDLDFCLRAGRLGWATELAVELGVMHHHGGTIGRAHGIAAHQDPVLLWPDLVRWARKHRGDRWARRAQRAMRWGGRLRLGCRQMARLFLRLEAAAAWDRDSAILRRALQHLRAESWG